MWRVQTNMEGTLYKWTNYLTGWQPRWFILDNGVLSYYKSQEDVNNACKGSIKMTVCDVVVHSSDPTRLDLIIPAEQHFYLRASTAHERQQWLIALGTSKACLTNGRSPLETGEMSPDIVKTKKSELRLYCDLLMEQVHSVKQSISSTDETPDIQKLNDATSLLSATCDTFIQTLEDCMKIANATISYEVPPHYTVDVPLLSPSKSNSKMGSRNHIRRSVDRSIKSSTSDLEELKSTLNNSTSDQNLSSKTTNGVDSLTSDSSDCQVSGCEDSSDGSRTSESRKMSTSPESDTKPNHIPVSPSPDQPTFFSTMPHSFSEATFDESEEILVEPFLSLCNLILPIFDKLNSTAFAPIKMDFSGNIRKLQAKQSTDAELTTLQKIIRSEIKSREQDNSNSATIAVLWLKRSLEFIRELLLQILNGQLDLTIATTEAYNRTLKSFHSWVVRGVFGLAVKAVPTYDSFVTQLCPANNDSGSIRKSEQILFSQMEAYTSALAPIIDSLNNFYSANSLNFDEQV